MLLRALGVWLPLGAALLLTAGCAGRSTEWCDKECSCEHCNDREYERCKINVDEQLDTADAYGCNDQADRVFNCSLDSGYCHLDHWVTDDADSCLGDWNDVFRCIDINSSL